MGLLNNVTLRVVFKILNDKNLLMSLTRLSKWEYSVFYQMSLCDIVLFLCTS